MTYNKINVAFGALRNVSTPPINYQYDQKQILFIKGLELPEFYTVDFCNDGDSTTMSMVGTAEGVEIPDEYLLTGKKVKAYIVITDGESVQTRYEVTIPVKLRPARSDIEPTPSEQSTIDSLVDAMNTAVSESEANADKAKEEADSAEDSATLSESWAIGGTGTREGEDTNNAKFFSEESERIGGEKATLAESWAIGQTGTRQGEDTNNSKHWSEEADRLGQVKATLAESWAVGGTGTRDREDQNNAKYYSELAAQHADESGYAWFDVHDDDGYMYVYISDNLSEDVSFAVDETAGILEVTYN